MSGEAAVPQGTAERVASLDLLRGLLALAVAVYHFQVWTRVFRGVARDCVVILGIYGVEVFFVISGFCMFHLYARTRFDGPELARFYVKRFLRIAPLYYLAMALTLASDPTFTPFTWSRLAENLTLSFGLFHPNHASVLGGWSIGIECVFYLVLPGLTWITQRTAARYLLALASIAWALPLTFGAIQAAAEAQRFHVYVQIQNQAFLFLLGGIIAVLRSRTRLRLPWLAVVGSLGLLVWIAARTQPPFADHFDVMLGWARVRYVALLCAAVTLLAFATPLRTRLLRPLTWLGDLSYSVYLMHPAAWYAIAHVLPAETPAPTLFGCGLIATLGLAALTHRYVERPAIACGRRLSESQAARGARLRSERETLLAGLSRELW